MRTALICLSLALISTQAHAQAWPQKPLRIVVGNPGGSPPDVVARAITPGLGELLGQPVITENRPGAGAVIAMEAVAKAPPDGYTLGLGTIGSLFLAKALIPTAEFDPLKSYQHIGLFTKTSFVLVVNAKVPANTVGELVALAKAQPGKLAYGAATVGTPPHILAEMFKSQAGVDLLGVNYKSSPDSIQALLGGDVQVLVDALQPLLPLIGSGRVKPLVVLSGARLKKLPAVPSAAEANLPDFAVESWFSLIGPAGLPMPIVRRLNAELTKTMERKDVAAIFDRMGFDILSSTPEQATALAAKDWPRWAAAVKASGAKAQ
jgi:tripartite-type tricarboxylate transporter receptor subunit TctC